MYVLSSSMMSTTVTAGLPRITLESPVSVIIALNASDPSAMVSWFVNALKHCRWDPELKALKLMFWTAGS